MPKCTSCGCDTGQPQHVDYPHEPGRLIGCPACDDHCHCTANATECAYQGEHNGLARLNLRLVDNQTPGVPVAVLPGTDYQVTTDEHQLAGWVVVDLEDGPNGYEAYGADGQYIGTAASPELAAALIPVPPAPESGYAINTPEHRVWEKAQEHGKAAASWVVDGNTSRVSARGLVKGIEDGDPAVMDAIREPSLGGEYQGDYTEDELMADVGWVPHDGTDLRDELATQYLTEVSTAFWHEVERLARNAAGDGDV